MSKPRPGDFIGVKRYFNQTADFVVNYGYVERLESNGFDIRYSDGTTEFKYFSAIYKG